MTGVYGSAQKQFEMSRTNILWKNLEASLCLLLFIRFIRVHPRDLSNRYASAPLPYPYRL